MKIYSRVSGRDISGLIIFLGILISGTKSIASVNPPGFISIDCGSDTENSTDSQTNLLWVGDRDYIIAGKNGLIQDEEMSFVPSTADNYEALKSFRYFPEEEKQSKYCYELPMRKSQASYLVRAMFLHGNATELSFPCAFQYYINGSLLFSLNFTDEYYTFEPIVVETIFFPLSDGSVINVCLVPIEGVPFISSLEIRGLDSGGKMYAKSFGDLIDAGVSFTNLLRRNLGSTNVSTVRYPEDPYDRLWTYPLGDFGLPLQNLSSQKTWSNIGPELNSIPSDVMKTSWISSESYYLHINLPYAYPGGFTYAIFYFALLNESTSNNLDIVNVALDTIQYPPINVTSQPSQETLFHTLNERSVAIQFNDSFILNALEIYLIQWFIIPTTFIGHVHIVNRIKELFNMTRWQGDPCTPETYDWLECGLGIWEGSEYFVNGLILSDLSNSSRLFELNSTYKDWKVYDLSITNSNIDSELFKFILGDLVNATQVYTLDMSFNAIDAIPGRIWWTEIAGYSDYNLYDLDLSSNLLRQIPPLRDFPFSSTLQTVNLSRNLFTGNFPNESYFSNLTSLIELNLSFNKFEGNIPWSLSTQNLPNLTILDISNNSFSGEFPSSFYFETNGSFQSLYVGNNQIKGVLNLTSWYNKLQRAISNTTTTVHATVDAPAITFNQSFSFVHNKIQSIEPRAEDFQFAIEKLMVRADFNESGILLGGNPYCKHAKRFAQRYLCRYEISDIVQPDEKEDDKKPIILGSVFGGLFLVLCFAFFAWRIRRLSKAVDKLLVEQELAKRKVQPPYFFYNDLKTATNNFHSSKHLGRGNFGAVYKGVLSDGTTIAVKKLFNSKQNQVLDEFLNEVVLITGIKHKNLIQLKGCCIENQERILVFGYAENGNIEDALWGDDSEVHLTWATRFKICVGIASGLTYLHEKLQPRIIHRDIKPANVLLDKNLDPKIADFGLAKHFVENIDVHVTQVVTGTRGYFAPEYISEGKVSNKIDVFSFGVLALEIVSGRRCIDTRLLPEEIHLTSWAHKLQRSGSLLELLDPVVGPNYPETQVLKVMNIALMCVRHDPDTRPTMSEVETMLLEGQESTYAKLNSASLNSREERDLSSEDLIYKNFGGGMGSGTVAMLFPNSRESSTGGSGGKGRRMKNLEESPLLYGNKLGEAYEEIPSFDTTEAYSRALRSMNRSLSERIIRGSSSSGSI